MADVVISDFQMPGDSTRFVFYGKPMYGVCNTSSGMQTKQVTITGFTAPMLVAGARIVVKFNYAQGYPGIPQLRVNSFTAKSINRDSYHYAGQYEWTDGAIIEFIYDGETWIIENGEAATTTYYGKTKLSSSTSSTATDMAATPSAVKEAYDLANDKSKATSVTITLPAVNWTNNMQTVTVSGVTSSNTIITTYAPASRADWLAADVYCSAQSASALTFTCSTPPSSNLTANVLIIN